ncbi:hypothetical protein ABP1_1332 [Bacillus subtilis]|nr:hypothetical protein ABP1_1332 [Bacillus subtilis]
MAIIRYLLFMACPLLNHFNLNRNVLNKKRMNFKTLSGLLLHKKIQVKVKAISLH